jgi:class 3 adenylate cyclase
MPREQRDVGDELSKLIEERVGDSILSRFERKGPGAGRQARPDGMVTIVFTDVVESSALVSRLGDQPARELIRAHDEVLRRTVKEHDGVEVERAGDGFMIAFSTASRAVEFALQLQRALGEQRPDDDGEIRVRIGMETGEVIAEEQGYFGGTVFRAARISELAGGGQILVSHATALIAGIERFGLEDVGERDLRGLGSQHLFEARGSAASSD